MTKAIALARYQFAQADAPELSRVGLVFGCALALIAAGPVLPF
ncbi:MAG: hypothetical protein ACR2FJ_02175 [Qipengyuania sp.]